MRPNVKIFSLMTLLVVAMVVLLSFRTAANAQSQLFYGDPSAVLFPSDLISEKLIEFETTWTSLAEKNISPTGDVAYDRLLPEKAKIDELFNTLISKFSIEEFEQNQKKAFLINVYNILTIRAILEFYPLRSVMEKVDRTRLGFHFWKDTSVWIGQKAFSLDYIEHSILRKMSDPRIHFALVCAAKSCPRLLNASYEFVRINDQLQLATKEFFAAKSNFQVNHSEQSVFLSALMEWYGVDFGQNEQEILTLLEKFLPASMQDDLQRPLGEYRIVEYLPYDWSLNDWH